MRGCDRSDLCWGKGLLYNSLVADYHFNSVQLPIGNDPARADLPSSTRIGG